MNGERVRPLRADARRNRDKLLTVAASSFALAGAGASLEGIAREAGVGIGTLYRHFPTRESLVLAAYWHEVERLCDTADELLATLPPDRALREWMGRLTRYAITKRGMAEALTAATSSEGAGAAARVRPGGRRPRPAAGRRRAGRHGPRGRLRRGHDPRAGRAVAAQGVRRGAGPGAPTDRPADGRPAGYPIVPAPLSVRMIGVVSMLRMAGSVASRSVR